MVGIRQFLALQAAVCYGAFMLAQATATTRLFVPGFGPDPKFSGELVTNAAPESTTFVLAGSVTFLNEQQHTTTVPYTMTVAQGPHEVVQDLANSVMGIKHAHASCELSGKGGGTDIAVCAGTVEELSTTVTYVETQTLTAVNIPITATLTTTPSPTSTPYVSKNKRGMRRVVAQGFDEAV